MLQESQVREEQVELLLRIIYIRLQSVQLVTEVDQHAEDVRHYLVDPVMAEPEQQPQRLCREQLLDVALARPHQPLRYLLPDLRRVFQVLPQRLLQHILHKLVRTHVIYRRQRYEVKISKVQPWNPHARRAKLISRSKRRSIELSLKQADCRVHHLLSWTRGALIRALATWTWLSCNSITSKSWLTLKPQDTSTW